MSENNENKDNQAYGGEQIQVLEGLEAVRKRPGMYIGSTSGRGLHHLVYEIVDNSIDEALAGFCNEIAVEILPGDIIRVTDNGRGIPTGIQPKMGIPAVTVVFTILHAGGKFGGGGYKVAGGLHGVGSSVVNALSEYLEVRVFQNGNIYKQRFERGNVASELEIVGTCEHTGTEVIFKPDPEIFQETTVFEREVLITHMREQAFLNAGLKIIVRDLRDTEPFELVMHYEGGIKSFVEYINKKRALEPIHEGVIYCTATEGDSIAEIALQYNDSYN
ncbi:MAG: ATP-binding protein, partial [Oscillospiraceae bacterium]